VRSESQGDGTIGVRHAIGAMRFAAASMCSIEIAGGLVMEES